MKLTLPRELQEVYERTHGGTPSASERSSWRFETPGDDDVSSSSTFQALTPAIIPVEHGEIAQVSQQLSRPWADIFEFEVAYNNENLNS